MRTSSLAAWLLLGTVACRPEAGPSRPPTPLEPVAPALAPDHPEDPSRGPAEARLPARVEASPLAAEIDRLAAELRPAVIEYRRDLHQHPELGNREHRTAKVIAEHLRRQGWEVREGVAHTGLVAVLQGGRPGPVVALRAEMDALPVKEDNDLPFASKATAIWRGESTPVMHACGHDLHMAIVMGVAELLPRLRDRLPGTVKLLLQPAEEGAPPGEEGGAALMIAEGALRDPVPEVIFGLHAVPEPVGDLLVRSGPTMASSDRLRIVVRGEQTHGAYPWRGVDPVTVAAQVVLGLQTIVSRQLDMTRTPSVISIGSIHGGLRSNIIPEEVEMIGTIRTFDPEIREELHRRIRATAEHIAQSAQAEATVTIEAGYPVVDNDPELLERMRPTLARVAGPEHLRERAMVLGAEDFSFYQQQIPGMFFFLGVLPSGTTVEDAASNHSPRWLADEGALQIGVRAMANLVVDYAFAAAP
ncbi:MAG: amidohydrolase [Myxococcales bacterium]|nr:amidohydrolase [Myxococcales bacterium]MCB9717485.1 amidohydrolase [Myxococcales bacterium]